MSTRLPMEIHSYYFTDKSGALKGVVANGSIILNISGPFISFNTETRLLSDARHQYYLPINKIETSSQLNARTTEQLRKLSNKITS